MSKYVNPLSIKVSDTGIGMSEEFLPSLFELFTRERNTTLSKIPGTGLGIAIVKNLVDLMNGSIEVESELGKGSTFTITIPHKIANKDYTNRNIESSNEFDIDFKGKDTFNKLGYKAKINTHTTSYIN